VFKNYSNALFALMISGGPALVFADVNTSGVQLSAYGGVADTSLDSSNYMLFGDQLEVLSPTNSGTSNFAWGFGAAYRFLLPSYLHDVSVGLDLLHLPSTQTGDLLDYGTLDYSTYRLTFKSTRLMADSEWTFHSIGPRLYPFLEAGIGFSANTINYSTTPDSDAAWEVAQKMTSNTVFQLAYNVGGGVKFALSDRVGLSFRYLYAGLGSAKTNTRTALLSTTAGIDTSAHSGTWLAGLTYLL